jgi:hypothetical protein
MIVAFTIFESVSIFFPRAITLIWVERESGQDAERLVLSCGRIRQPDARRGQGQLQA